MLDLIALTFDDAPERVIAIGPDLRILYANSIVAEVNELTIESLIGSQCHSILSLCDDPCEGCLAREVFETGRRTQREKLHTFKDGSTAHVLQRWFGASHTPDGSPSIVLEIAHDITALRVAEQQAEVLKQAAEVLRQEKDRAQSYLDVAAAVMLALDTEGVVTLINRRGLEMLGCTEDEVVGKDWFETFSPPEQTAEYRQWFQQVIETGTLPLESFEDVVLRPDGSTAFIHWHDVILRDEDGVVTGMLSSGLDLTEYRAAEKTIARMAFRDPLTGLANRSLFADRLHHAVESAKRSGSWLALACLDIDQFKLINDTLGSRQGDTLLVEASERLEAALRTSDTLARLGSDEFAVIFEDLESQEEAEELPRKLMSCFANPFEVAGEELTMTASVGVATMQAGEIDAEQLLAYSHTAMCRAKDHGRRTYRLYEAEMGDEARAQFNLSRGLGDAILRGELILHYQPQFALLDGRMTGVEALVRWNHPTRGLLAPLVFLPAAEESGMIVPLGRWVLTEACRQAAVWQRLMGPDFTVAVNLSARQFEDPGLIEMVETLIEQTGLAPGTLEFEITESIAMCDAVNMRTTFDRLRALGIRLAIDDFGTGFSSLDQLMRLHVDTLKLDRRFVTDLGLDARVEAIADSVIYLGHRLGLRVVAEGVEEQRHIDFLRRRGCDEIQGFLVGVPATPDDLSEVLARGFALM